jgi:hypothetical protein
MEPGQWLSFEQAIALQVPSRHTCGDVHSLSILQETVVFLRFLQAGNAVTKLKTVTHKNNRQSSLFNDKPFRFPRVETF